MDSWPIQSLCTEMGSSSLFYFLLGDYCDPPCYFGTKNGGTVCTCNKGYWNTSCNAECPGGANNPCSGYGTCDDSGKCNCPLNKQGADDCSVCSMNWIGSNCEFAENTIKGNISVAMASQLGHMTSFDGLSYIVREPSVYTLLTISDVIQVQGKLVICHQNYTCITFLSIRIGDSPNGYATITFKAPPLNTNKPIVFIENQENSVDQTLYFKGFEMERLDVDELKIAVGKEAEIIVRLQGQYLTMNIALSKHLVNLTSGLLGGSDQESSTMKLEQLMQQDIYSLGSVSIQVPSTTQTSYDLLFSDVMLMKNESFSSLDLTRFVPSDEFIYYPTIYDKNQNVGGYSLNFASSVVYGDVDFYTNVGPNITFDLLIKLGNETQSGGVLFAFTNTKSFIVQMSESIEIIYENETYVTNMTLEQNEWNKIILMYYGELGECDIYVFSSSESIERRNYMLPLHIFNNPGTLSIGHWQPPFNSKILSTPVSLKGQIENFLVWKIPVEPNIVTDIFQINPLDIQHLLNSLWQFDEGQGSKTSDFLQGNIINLPVSPWVPPEWIPSDLYYEKNVYPEVTYIYYDSNETRTKAEAICGQIIDNTHTDCSNMSSSTKQIFYTACLQVYSVTKDLGSAYNVLLNYGIICQESLGLKSSPLLSICSSLNNAEKENSGCQRQCLFGVEQSDGTCLCQNGYYGTVCSSICPGGSDSPCHNNGNCNSSGQCECEWNWKETYDCKTCTSGMNGPDCRILYVGQLGTKAYITGKGDFMGFNGYQISLDEISGVYTAFKDSSDNFAIEVYQVSCIFGSCIIGMSIRDGETQIVIMSSGQDNMAPIVYKNMVKLNYEKKTNLSSTMTLELNSFTELEITYSSSSIQIWVQDQWIDISLNLPSVCSMSTGILGSCNGQSESYTSYSQTELMSIIKNKFESVNGPIVNTMYSIYGQNITLNAGFALSFNDTSSRTETLTYKSGNVLDSQKFSLSLYFKPSTIGGVILAYSKNTTFTILNRSPMVMQCGTKTISTTSSPIVDEWNQIIITFDASKKQMHFYHYGPNITIFYEILDDFCPNLFEEGGKISLGEWIPSYQSEKYMYTEAFVGVIEEASVWKDPIPPALIFQAESLDVRLSGFLTNVTTLWSFSEGIGHLAFDTALGNNMNLPTFPWQSPAWIVSDKTLKIINKEAVIKTEIYSEADKLCSEFFDFAAISCSEISEDNRWWFKSQCIYLGSSSSNVSNSVYAITSFIAVCKFLGGAVDTLFTDTCKLKTEVPFWVSQKCNDCGFGYLGSHGSCTCYYGFHDTNCDKVCPNGIILPCNGNGICDTSGVCQCDGHWDGTTCDICSTGWIGDECVVMLTGQNQPNPVAQISVNGQIISFDGHVIDVTSKKVYKLFSHETHKVNIYVHISTCFDTSRSHLCPRDIAFNYEGNFYYIRSENSFEKSKVVIFTNTGEINVYDTHSIGEIRVTISANNVLEVTFTDINLTLKIIYIDNALLTTITYSNSNWKSELYLSGLLTSCNTTIAIQLSSCNVARLDICDDLINPANTFSCNQTLNIRAVEHYLASFEFVDTYVDTVLERQYVISGPSCFLFNGVGVYVKDLSLPMSLFTIEFHAKPNAPNGPMLTYHTNDHYTIVVTYKTGIVIIADHYVYETNIMLELNVWNQINIVWDLANYRLEIYMITNSGITIVKEIAVAFNIFETGGTLTVGQLGNGVTTLVPIGTYNGYIDEIRIWTRPHNPSIIKSNWRIAITGNTPDLHAAWSLNEGAGYVIFDLKNSQHMFVVNFEKPPTWSPSDLELSPGIDLKLPQLTTTEPLNITDTTECDFLNTPSKFLNACNENFLESMYHDQCKTLVKITRDPNVAEILRMSLSDYCHRECVFGTTDSDTCICDGLHYGNSCSNACAIGTLGVCNAQGMCDSTSGQCSCSAHWYGQNVSVSIYWKSLSSYVKTTISIPEYSCSHCSKGWFGADCNFVVQREQNVRSHSVGFLFASYITTLDGASYRMITPGIYNIYTTSGISVQMVYWPCLNDIYCRQVKEISINSGGQTVSVMRHNDTLQLIHVGGATTFNYPVTTTLSSISIKWIVKEYIRITVGGFSVLVSDSNIGLICRFKVDTSGGKAATGLLGNTDSSWWMDLLSPSDKVGSDTSLIESRLSVKYTGEWSKEQFGTSLASVHTWHENRQQNLSTAGFILHLTLQTVSYTNVYANTDLSAFTISFYVRIQKYVTNQTMVIYQSNGTNLTLSVESGLLVIHWGSTRETGPQMEVNAWIYLTFTWQSSNGQFFIYMITNGELQYKVITHEHVGTKLNIEAFYLIGNTESPLEIDYFRFWKVAKSLDNIYAIEPSYLNAIDNELVSTVMFDEGSGLTSKLVTQTASVTGIISEPETNDLWIPSDIPIKNEYLPKQTSPSNINDTVLNDCINALNNSDVKQYCSDISNITEFYFEACLMDYHNIGDNATLILVVNNLIFYCQTTFNVDECKLKNYFDYCTDEESEEDDGLLLIIIIICVIVFICILICCCCCCCWHGLLCFKRFKRKSAPEEKDCQKQAFAEHDQMDEDLAYSRSRINSRNSDFLCEVRDDLSRAGSTLSRDGAKSAISTSDFPILFETNDDDDELISPVPPRDTFFTPSPAPPLPGHSKEGPRSKSSLLASLSGLIPKIKSGGKGNHPAPALHLQDTNVDDSPNVALAQPRILARQTNATPVFGKKFPAVYTKHPSATPVFNNPASTFNISRDDERPDSASSIGSKPGSRSPFVSPGAGSFDNDGDGTVSPFQPEDTQSVSVINRCYTPDTSNLDPVFPKSHALSTKSAETSLQASSRDATQSLSSFKPHKPIIAFTENKGRTSRAADAIHGAGPQDKGRTSRAADAIHGAGPQDKGRSSRVADAIHGAGPQDKGRTSRAADAIHGSGPQNKGRSSRVADAIHGSGPQDKGRISRTSDAIHGSGQYFIGMGRTKSSEDLIQQMPPNEHSMKEEEEVIIRPPSYNAPTPGLLIDLTTDDDTET